ncbi:hypothetical protein [Arthrobacter sp. 24S4-2]|uniref:hypothetical protein n=1 Tax=Arthrobacter sp. 24S4-2 TaxID=2575374 RepID=UPI0020C7DAA4|nr:hypothetical protein [Arthrobacter sp. 24S4-2]
MRIMHLGFETHVLGEATAPSVRSGDGLFIISNSGTSPISTSFARIARAQSATVALLTSTPNSP